MAKPHHNCQLSTVNCTLSIVHCQLSIAKLVQHLRSHYRINFGGLHVWCLASRHKNKVVALLKALPQLRLQQAKGLPYHTPCTAALNCIADFFRGNKPQAVHPSPAGTEIADECAADYAFALFEKILELPVLFDAYEFFCVVHSLVGQSFSALCTSSCKHLSAVRGGHSFSEAVLHFSLTLFRLIWSFHFTVFLSDL